MVGPPNPLSNLRPVKYGSAFEEELDGPSTSAPGSSKGAAFQIKRTEGLAGAGQSSHPYSLSEFSSLSGEGQRAGSSSRLGKAAPKKPHSAYFNRILERLEAAELEHRLRRVRSDAFHERFWADNNVRFEGDMDGFRANLEAQTRGTAAPSSEAPASDAQGRPQAGAQEAKALSPEQKRANSDSLAPFYTAWLTANASRHKAYNRALVGGLFRDLGPAFRYERLRWWAGLVRRAERMMGRGT